MKQKITQKISASILAIFGLAFFVAGASAQEDQKIIEAPKIYVQKVLVDQVDQGGNMNVSFSLQNQENKDFYDLYYQANLELTSGSADDNLVGMYDPKNLAIVDSVQSSDPIFIKGNEAKTVNFSYKVPNNIIKGNYIIKIQLFAKDYVMLSLSLSRLIALDGNNKFLGIDSVFVERDGKNFDRDAGVDFGENDAVQGLLKVKSYSDEQIDVYPSVTVFDRDQFNFQITQGKGDSVSFSAGEEKDVEINIPKPKKAGSFLAKVQFLDQKDNQPISSPVFLRFVVRGESGRIIELLSDKGQYAAGETMKINARIIGSADSFITDRDGNVIQNPERKNVSSGTLEISLINVRDGKIIQNIIKNASLSADLQDITYDVPLKDKLISYEIKAVLKSGGKELDTKSIKSISTEPKNKIVLKQVLIGFALLPIILIGLFLIKRRYANVAIFFFVVVSSLVVVNNAKATYTMNWYSPANNEVYYYDYCAGGGNWWVYTGAGLTVTSCSNAATDYKAEWYIDGSLVDTVNRYNLSIGEMSGGLASTVIDGSIVSSNNYVSSGYRAPGNHTIRLRLTVYAAGTQNVVDTYDQTRSYTVQRKANVYGYVYQGASLNTGGINGATVEWVGQQTQQTYNNGIANGSYCFSRDVSTGGYGLNASASGFNTIYDSFGVTSTTALVRKDFQMTPISQSAPTCSVSFSPNSITAPGRSTATVTMANATGATYGCSGPIPAASGSALGVAASAPYQFDFTATQTGTETCTVSVTGPGGSGSCSGSVSVNPPGCSPTNSCQTSTCSNTTCWNGCSNVPGTLTCGSGSSYKCNSSYVCEACSCAPTDLLCALQCRYATRADCSANCSAPPPSSATPMQLPDFFAFEFEPRGGGGYYPIPPTLLSGQRNNVNVGEPVDFYARITGGSSGGGPTYYFYGDVPVAECDETNPNFNPVRYNNQEGAASVQSFGCNELTRSTRAAIDYGAAPYSGACYRNSSASGSYTYTAPGTYYAKVKVIKDINSPDDKTAGCVTVNVTCSPDGTYNCVRTPSNISACACGQVGTATCFDSCGQPTALANCGGTASCQPITCPACPTRDQNWREVAP